MQRSVFRFPVKWKIHESIMTSEQANVTPCNVPSELYNQREGNDRRCRMESADELNEQIALVADIENTRHYSDVVGKWETSRRTSSNTRIRRETRYNYTCWARSFPLRFAEVVAASQQNYCHIITNRFNDSANKFIACSKNSYHGDMIIIFALASQLGALDEFFCRVCLE